MWPIYFLVIVACAFPTAVGQIDTFSRLVDIYRKACPPVWNETEQNKQPCCGVCSRHDTCLEYDNNDCCFDEYDNIGQALGYHDFPKDHGETCVLPKLTHQANANHRDLDSTAGFWMRHSCIPNTDLITVKLCKNPGINNHFLSLVPTSYAGSDGHILLFRNRFCLKCYGLIDDARRLYWHLSVQCEKRIAFNEENLLQVVQEKNCEVNFKQPPNTFAPQCNYSVEAQISSCNVTGLWQKYDNGIEAACHSFTDAFNRTYRNYFCYLCNTDNPKPRELWSCEAPSDQQDKSDDRYTIDLSVDLIRKTEDGIVLGCDPETQFIDLKKMICRNFHCNGFTYVEHTCKRRRIEPNMHCLVLSVKLTFGARNPFPEQKLDEKKLWEAIINDVASPALLISQMKDVKIYLKTMNQSGVSYLDYIIVQMYFAQSPTTSNTNLERFVSHIHGRPCYIGIADVFPWCEIVIFDSSAEEQHRELIAPAVNTTRPEVKRSLHYHFTSKYCRRKNLRVVSKLFFCLHVKLRKNELQMEIDKMDDVLIITINSAQVFRFSHWEYEFTNEIINICIEDYLMIYRAMPANVNEVGLLRNGVKEESGIEIATLVTVAMFSVSMSYVRGFPLITQ